jgi:hypothetical protein
MGVVEPIKVTITNLDAPLELEAADFPFAPERGSHKVVLTPEVFIDASDFRMEDSKDYFGLAPGALCVALLCFAELILCRCCVWRVGGHACMVRCAHHASIAFLLSALSFPQARAPS